MQSAPDERAPRKNAPPKPSLASPLITSPATPLPSAGGKAPSPARFTPKYIPRLLAYDLPEYQEENWRD